MSESIAQFKSRNLNWNLLTNIFAKNKPVESTDYETGLPDATLTEE
jgi:hypothetical protein